jgi:hypothetical protein
MMATLIRMMVVTSFLTGYDVTAQDGQVPDVSDDHTIFSSTE